MKLKVARPTKAKDIAMLLICLGKLGGACEHIEGSKEKISKQNDMLTTLIWA
jgi:hypothetical protein